jgi:MFS superfamily sulfate permease-like transporter
VLATLVLAATPALELVPAAALVGILAAAALGLVLFERFRFAEFRREVQEGHS